MKVLSGEVLREANSGNANKVYKGCPEKTQSQMPVFQTTWLDTFSTALYEGKENLTLGKVRCVKQCVRV